MNLPLTTATLPYVAANDLGRVTKLTALALKSRLLLYAASDLFNTPSWAGGFSKPELISLPAGDRNARWKAASDAAIGYIGHGEHVIAASRHGRGQTRSPRKDIPSIGSRPGIGEITR